MSPDPLKRSQFLRSLSHEHHHGLVLCRKIRKGLKGNVEIDRIISFLEWFYRESLENHFEIEEEHCLPVLGMDHELVKRTLSEHRELKALFRREAKTIKTLELIAEKLEKHIRFEERVLFPKIERVATEKELSRIIENHNSSHPKDKLEDWKKLFTLMLNKI